MVALICLLLWMAIAMTWWLGVLLQLLCHLVGFAADGSYFGILVVVVGGGDVALWSANVGGWRQQGWGGQQRL